MELTLLGRNTREGSNEVHSMDRDRPGPARQAWPQGECLFEHSARAVIPGGAWRNMSIYTHAGLAGTHSSTTIAYVAIAPVDTPRVQAMSMLPTDNDGGY